MQRVHGNLALPSAESCFAAHTTFCVRCVLAAVCSPLCCLHNRTQQHTRARAHLNEQAKDVQGADDAKNRSLPQDLFAKILGAKLGIPVDPTQVRAMLQKGFGEEATKKVLGVLGQAQGQIDKMAKGTGPHAKHASMVSKILGMCLGGAGGSSAGAAGAAGGAGGAAVCPPLHALLLPCRFVVALSASSLLGACAFLDNLSVLSVACSSTGQAHPSQNVRFIEVGALSLVAVPKCCVHLF